MVYTPPSWLWWCHGCCLWPSCFRVKQKVPQPCFCFFLLAANCLFTSHPHLPPLAWHSCFYASSHPASDCTHTHNIHFTQARQRSRRPLGLVILTFDPLFSSWRGGEQMVGWQWYFNSHTHTQLPPFSSPRSLHHIDLRVVKRRGVNDFRLFISPLVYSGKEYTGYLEGRHREGSLEMVCVGCRYWETQVDNISPLRRAIVLLWL